MLIALVSLLATQAAALPQPTCGCAPFHADSAAPPALSTPDARAIRDFSLFSHRKLADDLVRQDGVYLDTLLAALDSCADRGAKLSWLRRVAADSADTSAFAGRIVRAYEQGNLCPRPDVKS